MNYKDIKENLSSLRSKVKFNYKTIFAVFAFFMIISLRSAVFSIPQQISGKEFLAFDELIPIFDIKTQYFDQITNGYSPLTDSDEIRVRYSFATTWTRYYPLLTLSLVFMNAGAFTIFVYGSKKFLDMFFEDEEFSYNWKLFIATAVNSGLFILLLYNKITHFYTLIFGLALFILSFIKTLELFKEGEINKRKIILIILLTVLNPAVHYHVFYLLFASIIFLAFGAKAIFNKSERKPFLKGGVSLAIIFILNLALYAVFLFGSSNTYSAKNLNSQAPVNYSTLKNASIELKHIFAMDLSSPVDNYLYQDYTPNNGNSLNIIFFIIAFIPVGYFFIKKKSRQNKVDYLIVFSVLLISLYLTLGMTFALTPYSLIADNINSPFFHTGIGNIILKLAQTFVQVIRFPHRFQLVYYTAITLTTSVAVCVILILISSHIKFSRRKSLHILSISTVILISAIPLFSSKILNTTIVTGNWEGIFSPIKISGQSELDKIVGKDEKIFFAPSLELNNFIVDDKNYVHRFIDKFWLYYFDKNSSYYGLGGDIDNKLSAFLFYRAALYEDPWWVKILRDQGYNYIGYIKNTQSTVFDLDRSVDKVIQSNSSIKQVYENDYLALYKIEPVKSEKETVVITEWNSFIKLMNENSKLNNNKFTYGFNLTSNDLSGKQILTDDEGSAKLYYESLEHPDEMITIPEANMTFNRDVFPSSYFQQTVLSPLNILSTKDSYNRIGMSFPSILFKGSTGYIGMQKSFSTKFSFSTQNSCNLYLSSANNNNNVEFKLYKSGTQVGQSSLDLAQNSNLSVNFTKLDLAELSKGKYEIEFTKKDNNPFVFNYLICADKDYQSNLKLISTGNVTLSDGKILKILTKE
jgi:hypothetical protein